MNLRLRPSQSLTFLLLLLLLLSLTIAQHHGHFQPSRSAIVQLFEWPFADIARECEQFLGPRGFAAVQTSTVTEHLILPGRPWYGRYQPMSYRVASSLGNASHLADMTRRCGQAGIRVYVDVVLNHMAGQAEEMVGCAGSLANFEERWYPAVPYQRHEFHRACEIVDIYDAHMVRNCDLYELPDLDQSLESVRQKMAKFLNELVELGVAGFRVGGCKYMWPNDLKAIYGRLNNLSVQHGFELGARPFIMQEVNDNGLEPISNTEYTFAGTVGEINYSKRLVQVFGGKLPISNLRNIGPVQGFVHSRDAVVFVDNHDTQRKPVPPPEANEAVWLSFKTPRSHQQAVAFMLAHEYGTVRLMSSYEFEHNDAGPPTVEGSYEIRSPFAADGAELVGGGWVAEHRWPITVAMVGWRSTVANETMRKWRTVGLWRVSFCRGNRGFVAFNVAGQEDWVDRMSVCVPPGVYCEVIARETAGGVCGNRVVVDEQGMADVRVAGGDGEAGVWAIHVNAMVGG